MVLKPITYVSEPGIDKRLHGPVKVQCVHGLGQIGHRLDIAHRQMPQVSRNQHVDHVLAPYLVDRGQVVPRPLLVLLAVVVFHDVQLANAVDCRALVAFVADREELRVVECREVRQTRDYDLQPEHDHRTKQDLVRDVLPFPALIFEIHVDDSDIGQLLQGLL